MPSFSRIVSVNKPELVRAQKGPRKDFPNSWFSLHIVLSWGASALFKLVHSRVEIKVDEECFLVSIEVPVAVLLPLVVSDCIPLASVAELCVRASQNVIDTSQWTFSHLLIHSLIIFLFI